MKVDVEQQDGITIVSPQGKLDAINAQAFDQALDEIMADQPSKMIIDLGGVPYISSAGLRVFIVAARQMKENGTLAVTNAAAVVKEVFDLAGFTSIMAICDDLEAAKQQMT